MSADSSDSDFEDPFVAPSFEDGEIDRLKKKQLVAELNLRGLEARGSVETLRRYLSTATYPHFIKTRVERANREWADLLAEYAAADEGDDAGKEADGEAEDGDGESERRDTAAKRRVSFGASEIRVYKKAKSKQ